MKTLTLSIFWWAVCVPSLLAQSADVLLEKAAEALSSGADDYAVSLFRQSVRSDADKAEMFYWTQVPKSSAVAPRLIKELAVASRERRSYDKAYLFYKEYLHYHPSEVSALASLAEVQLMRGKENESRKLYEQVITLDPDHLQACIFLGNYYYLQAERERKKIETDYRKIASPTRMQYARYRDKLSSLFSTEYSKARNYLQQVLRLFPSTEAGVTLKKIKEVEAEINRR